MRSAVVRLLAVLLVVGSGFAVTANPAEAAARGTIRLASPSAQPVLRGDAMTLAVRFGSAAGRTVRVQRAAVGSSRWVVVKRGKLTRRGTFTWRSTPASTYRYRAFLPRSGGKAARVSNALTVKVVKGWRQLSAGQSHSCGIWWNGSAWCWGFNGDGQFGHPTPGVENDAQVTPVKVDAPAAGASWRAISAGVENTCGIRSDRSLWCWGGNDKGQLGQGATGAGTPVPTRITTPSGSTWLSVDVAYETVCALRADRTLWCWGRNDYQQVGFDSAGSPVLTPTKVTLPGVSSPQWSSVSLADYHGCAVRTNAALWCWGQNGYGESGHAGTDRSITLVPGPSGSWKSVAVGNWHTCGQLPSGVGRCFGLNSYGQLASATNNGVSLPNPTPAPMLAPFDAAALALASGDYYSCGLRPDRTLWCWGANTYGQIAFAADAGATDAHPNPIRVSTATWRSVVAGPEHACAIRSDHSGWCWGRNFYGQTGNVANVDSDNPNPGVVPVGKPPV